MKAVINITIAEKSSGDPKWDSVRSGGYTQAQLNGAFDLVRNATHWKYPIDRTLPDSLGLTEDDFDLIKRAIIDHTGSVPTIRKVAGGTRVRAIGYFAAIGA